MNLPITSLNPILWISPERKFINLARGSSTLVTSAVEKIGNRQMVQNNPALQPTWDATSLNGNPGFVFTGNQYMTIPFGNTILTGTQIPMTMATVFKTTATAIQVLLGILDINTGSFGAQFVLAHINNIEAYHSDSLFVGEVASKSGATNNNTVYILSSTADSYNVTLRLNGVVVAQTAALSTKFKLDLFSFGGYPDGTLLYNGVLGDTIVYYGSQGITDVEKFLAAKYGVTLGGILP